ncbi:MAG TPA: hypothetical protein VGR03_08825 [Candidatus Acidoferrum sp.]|jgi:hypothetical protein|nr:hypothetical protein [Candidatus Acidoferrum sp.]
MLLICANCKTKNFLDPYPFWNFKGNTKCAGCGKIWRLETSVGACVSGPDLVEGKPDLLPGFAEKPDYSPISGPGLTRSAPRARPTAVCRPIPIERNVRGKLVSGHPLKKEDLVGSRPRFIQEGM